MIHLTFHRHDGGFRLLSGGREAVIESSERQDSRRMAIRAAMGSMRRWTPRPHQMQQAPSSFPLYDEGVGRKANPELRPVCGSSSSASGSSAMTVQTQDRADPQHGGEQPVTGERARIAATTSTKSPSGRSRSAASRAMQQQEALRRRIFQRVGGLFSSNFRVAELAAHGQISASLSTAGMSMRRTSRHDGDEQRRSCGRRVDPSRQNFRSALANCAA